MKKASKKGKNFTKTQLLSEIASRLDIQKTLIGDVLNALEEIVHAEVKSGSSVTIPGLVKISLKNKPARPARQGRNPATGETIMISAKPAKKAVKVSAIKALKEIV